MIWTPQYLLINYLFSWTSDTALFPVFNYKTVLIDTWSKIYYFKTWYQFLNSWRKAVTNTTVNICKWIWSPRLLSSNCRCLPLIISNLILRFWLVFTRNNPTNLPPFCWNTRRTRSRLTCKVNSIRPVNRSTPWHSPRHTRIQVGNQIRVISIADLQPLVQVFNLRSQSQQRSMLLSELIELLLNVALKRLQIDLTATKQALRLDVIVVACHYGNENSLLNCAKCNK